tara:strand:- start:1511 stop:1687 length:177 start_codon:yes stop_codon:yes gene_type:complete
LENLATDPGIEINVIPDKEAPIIPKATTYHGDFLSPIKKDSLESDFEVKKDISNRTKK